MFTLFHLLSLLGMLAGLLLGFDLGRHFGIIGSLVGTIIGGSLGFLAGRLPSQLADWLLFRQLKSKSTPELWSDLRNESFLTPNFLLLELKQRGEPLAEGLEIVLSRLVSDNRTLRMRGLAAFLSGFPEFEEQIKEYNPDAPDRERREIVNNVKLSLSSQWA